MRFTDEAHSYKKDFRREARGLYRSILLDELPEVIRLLAMDIPLPDKYNDHELSGKLEHHRECHVKPDLLLMYRKYGNDRLALLRLGSHTELFGK